MRLSVSCRREGETAIVAVDGGIDLSTVSQLEDQVAVAVISDDNIRVLVDLSGVTFMDATGISALLRGHRRAQAGGKPYQVDADGPVRHLLDMTGVWGYLSDHAT